MSPEEKTSNNITIITPNELRMLFDAGLFASPDHQTVCGLNEERLIEITNILQDQYSSENHDSPFFYSPAQAGGQVFCRYQTLPTSREHPDKPLESDHLALCLLCGNVWWVNPRQTQQDAYRRTEDEDRGCMCHGCMMKSAFE